ncbi:MAG: hypothetical protein ACK4UY_10110 [Dietzia sp.]
MIACFCRPSRNQLLASEEDGEIAYRGSTVMEGYWNQPGGQR